MRAACALAVCLAVGEVAPACYSGGGGTSPPPNTFYFPVGLAVSAGGRVLYAANSDFDLQWNGGTFQSYDLSRIRTDAADLVRANIATSRAGAGGGLADAGPWLDASARPATFIPWQPGCLDPGIATTANGARIPLGEACAPPVDSTAYVESSAVTGAFATDLQLVSAPASKKARLFSPVRGDATLTWADVPYDDGSPDSSPSDIECGQTSSDLRCDAAHHASSNPDPQNSRNVTMPGEPFAMALTEDSTAIAITHQTVDESSLLLSGFTAPAPPAAGETGAGPIADAGAEGGGESLDAGDAAVAGTTLSGPPVMEFVVDGLPIGGDGLAAVPHDLDAPVPPCEALPPQSSIPCVRPAFLETNNTTAEIDLLRYYSDDGSSLTRPFLVREAPFELTVNQIGTDSRGIAIDASPRLACKLQAGGAAASAAARRACAQVSARVFFANRSPPSLVIGEIGEPSPTGDGSYDPDLLELLGSVPTLNGPSRVYVAPIIDTAGHLVLRVFVVNFDSSSIQIFDPSDPDLALVDTIYVGPGPFAMAFDPFTLDDVVASSLDLPPGVQVPELAQDANGLTRYRFAYVASFTDSYVQMIDLDARQPTFESVVYNLGNPTPPKGSE